MPIRAKQSTKSQKLSLLFFGDAVIVIKKKRNWTLVEPVDESNKQLKGWIFTRYLKDIVSKKKRYKKNRGVR
ncbi:MAG: SH3 domain-containing protein [Syntrophomonadaceae bacterium]|nr:SH3 domain-containing protein [Syntrophomonadaceae bacterium]